MRDIGLRFFDTNGDEITWDVLKYPVFNRFMSVVWYFYVTDKQLATEFFQEHLYVKEADVVWCYKNNTCFCRSSDDNEWYTVESQIDFLIDRLSEERRNLRKISSAIGNGNFI